MSGAVERPTRVATSGNRFKLHVPAPEFLEPIKGGESDVIARSPGARNSLSFRSSTRARDEGRPKAPKCRAGRPTKYRAEFAHQAECLCELGATDADLAKFFDVAGRTVLRWRRSRPEFCRSIKRGKTVADAKVAEALYLRARSYSHPAVKIMQCNGVPVVVPYTKRYPPDTAACIFWLKNRRPDRWREAEIS